MAASVLISCGLNEKNLQKFTFLREDVDVDGSFLISCILGQRIKYQETGTILICFHHAYQHYVSAGQRLGYNLNTSIDKGNLTTIEPLDDIAEKLFTSFFLHSSKEELLNEFLQSIQSHIVDMFNVKNKKSVTVIIDDISVLINLGVSELQALRFCRKIQSLTEKQFSNLSIVLKVNTCELYERLCSNLEDLADVEIKLVKLKSGNFKEVDGKLVCVKKCLNGVEKVMLYKVNERNVKIFAPGEVGIKV